MSKKKQRSAEQSVAKMSFLDKNLILWIFLAMDVGMILDYCYGFCMECSDTVRCYSHCYTAINLFRSDAPA